jgi:tetratricopeptide (TPR) repeat protein
MSPHFNSMASIVRLQPRSESFPAALALFRTARFDDCLATLALNDGANAVILRARCLMRLDRLEESMRELEQIDLNLPDNQRAEMLLVKAAGLLRLDRMDDAERLLADCRVAAYSTAIPALEGDYELTEAALHYVTGDTSRMDASISRALAICEPREAWAKDSDRYLFSLRHVHARAYDLRGFSLRRVRGPVAQIECVRQALSEIDGSQNEDTWLYSHFLYNLAVLARENDHLDLIGEVKSRAASFDWSPNLNFHRFQTLSAIGWLEALSGDHIGALRQFRAAGEFAPSQSWKLTSVLDRAFLARELGQSIFAEDELLFATDLAGKIDWTGTRDVFFPSLVRLAQLVASNNPAAARKLLERYRKVRANMPATVFAKVDPIWHGVELMAEADVARAEGRNQLAIDLYINAFEAFDKLGCRWRASLAAIELSELTDQPLFRGYAAAEAQRRPNSWIARRMATIVQKRSEPALA